MNNQQPPEDWQADEETAEALDEDSDAIVVEEEVDKPLRMTRKEFAAELAALATRRPLRVFMVPKTLDRETWIRRAAKYKLAKTGESFEQ